MHATITALNGEQIKVDAEDFPLLRRHQWTISTEGYAMTYCGKYQVYMHRLIMAPLGSLYIDHKNHDRLDNRKKNLRITTNSGNQMNRKLTNISGVTWHKASGKWRARVKKNQKEIYLGVFDSKLDAMKARMEAIKNWENL